MPFCTKCGNELPEGARFCPRCGSEVARASVSEGAEELVRGAGLQTPPELSPANYEKLKLKLKLKSASRKKKWGVAGIAIGLLIMLTPTIFLAMDNVKTIEQLTTLAYLAKLCIIIGGLMLIFGIGYSTYGSRREKKIREKL
ncbi:MAG: zinc-ribbon domain-containing protein [Candidatus Hadarchaeum sp.]|uniref:zinc-ribbon domain-containing protein n=1 Tax=Candidatus Hadarchaeum sp. TaxID=2883567 RepID=UPI003D0ADE78